MWVGYSLTSLFVNSESIYLLSPFHCFNLQVQQFAEKDAVLSPGLFQSAMSPPRNNMTKKRQQQRQLWTMHQKRCCKIYQICKIKIQKMVGYVMRQFLNVLRSSNFSMKEFPQLPMLILHIYTYKCHTHTFNLLRYCQIFICQGTLEV